MTKYRQRYHLLETGNYIYKFQRKVGETWYDLRDDNRKLITEPNSYRAGDTLRKMQNDCYFETT